MCFRILLQGTWWGARGGVCWPGWPVERADEWTGGVPELVTSQWSELLEGWGPRRKLVFAGWGLDVR